MEAQKGVRQERWIPLVLRAHLCGHTRRLQTSWPTIRKLRRWMLSNALLQ